MVCKVEYKLNVKSFFLMNKCRWVTIDIPALKMNLDLTCSSEADELSKTLQESFSDASMINLGQPFKRYCIERS